MFKRLGVMILALAAIATTLMPAEVQAGGNRYRVEARMRSGSRVEAKADYRERSTGRGLERRLNVEVSGARPGQSFAITVNGAPFGRIVANPLGRAELEFRNPPDNNPDGDERPLPSNFPRIGAGDTVTVGAMTGTFRSR